MQFCKSLVPSATKKRLGHDTTLLNVESLLMESSVDPTFTHLRLKDKMH